MAEPVAKVQSPDWELRTETVLVRRNYEECMRGTRAPRPLVPPIYASSTYVLESAEAGEVLSNSNAANGYLYQRWGNPTADAAADVIAQLEGAAGTMLFSSGMAAINTTLFSYLKAGDHLVACQPCYGGVNSFSKLILQNLGIEISWVKGNSVEEYRKAVQKNTKLLYGESPANPTMSILDLEAFGELGKSLPNTITLVDCTFATPYLVQPMKYGIDLVIHSCTKYLAGHSDIIGGAVSYAKPEMGPWLREIHLLTNGAMAPFDAFLLHRSLKTLALRMDRHSENAMAVAHFLEQHPKVERVYYPGLASHPDHQLAEKQMKGFSGMVSFELKGGLDTGIKLVESTKVIVLAVSLGGVESLIEHPASMTHCDHHVSPEVKKASGITDGLIRLSVGIENIEDLIADLKQALDKL